MVPKAADASHLADGQTPYPAPLLPRPQLRRAPAASRRNARLRHGVRNSNAKALPPAKHAASSLKKRILATKVSSETDLRHGYSSVAQ
jgi:hypothetical protein